MHALSDIVANYYFLLIFIQTQIESEVEQVSDHFRIKQVQLSSD